MAEPTKDACACGWRLPVKAVRAYESGYKELVAAARVSVEFTCPECATEYELEWNTDEAVTVFRA